MPAWHLKITRKLAIAPARFEGHLNTIPPLPVRLISYLLVLHSCLRNTDFMSADSAVESVRAPSNQLRLINDHHNVSHVLFIIAINKDVTDPERSIYGDAVEIVVHKALGRQHISRRQVGIGM